MGGKIIIADAIDGLRKLPDCSINMCVTSPPYYGLRDYGTARWEGGDAGCDHIIGEYRTGYGLADSVHSTRGGAKKTKIIPKLQARGICPKCGAVRVDKQIGLEPTPEQYVDRLVAVFCEVRRTLKDDGTLWLNLGDSYAGSNKGYGAQSHGKAAFGADDIPPPVKLNLPPKNLLGIPWRVAFALQADGWILRQDIIWHKPNPMPESVRDRCTKAHEYLFLLSKSPRYYFDCDAIKEPAVGFNNDPVAGSIGAFGPDQQRRRKGNAKTFRGGVYTGGQAFNNSADLQRDSTGNAPNPTGLRNRRSVWTVATRGYKEAHFATFPEDLVAPCIKAGSKEGGTILDPFIGSGTVGKVAQRLGRDYIGIDINPVYAGMARRRIGINLFG